MMHRLIPVAAALLVAGCAIGPDYVRPASPLPDTYGATAENVLPAVDARWWQLFNDATLNTLVEAALRNNADIRTAVARVEQADAAARETGAALFPQIDGSTGLTNSKASTRSATYNTAMPTIRHTQSAALSTSFELDVWGRIRRADESARAQLLASRYGRDAVRLTVAGLTSSAYLNLRALDAQLALTAESLKLREESLALVNTRIEAGLASPLDRHQATTALATLQAQASDLRRQRALAEHQLALLCGQPDLKLDSGDLRELPLPPLPPAGLPASLIEARPDVRQAEQQLVAANAGIGLAKAGYYPKFSLTGSIGSESKTLADLFGPGAGTWSLGLGMLLPVLDFGRTSARVEQARALNEQSLVAWQNALQVAYKEVRDALVNQREYGEAEKAQTLRVEQSGQSMDIARKRYEAGYAGYMDLLDAQRSSNEARQALVSTRQARLVATVDLFKALGGGWQPDTPLAAVNRP